MSPLEKPIYRFEDVEVDPAQGCIKRADGETHLRQQTFQVLLYLLEQHERLVTKEELMGHIWKGDAVTDDALVQCVSDIRRALGDNPRSPRFIKTVPKVGYRFISPVEKRPANPGQSLAPSAFELQAEEITTIEVEYEEESPAEDIPGRENH
jgi:DNA-binding winged helix-turn-helix (wHTH) protein